ncbi:tetratricopeptide repeat protein [Candidatus Peregrinibacteria bacterium]|jgi:tetratricopeptide (TPR) repeat protein|nr:tetratricopeptide repeat protein [Candidatus Peregrinibacteria bacterium]
MKKLIITMITLSILLTACTGSNWQFPVDHLPEEFLDVQREIIDENLEILKENPENFDATFEIGYRYGQLGQLKNAAEYYLKALEIAPLSSRTMNNLANTYEKAKEYEEAAIYAKMNFERNTTSVEALKDVVRILLKADEPNNAATAVSEFLAATSLEDGQPNPNYALLVSELSQDIHAYNTENTE